jgi:hypothetical protein
MDWSPVVLATLVYALLVFSGAALLGFVAAPFLGTSTGLFSIEAESAAFFSLLTLKGVPYLVALSVLSGLWFARDSSRPVPTRVALWGLNVALAWLVAASIAFAILG